MLCKESEFSLKIAEVLLHISVKITINVSLKWKFSWSWLVCAAKETRLIDVLGAVIEAVQSDVTYHPERCKSVPKVSESQSVF